MRLAQALKVPHISTGELLREEIQNSTPIGLQVTEYMNAGELAPDSIMIDLFEHRLRESGCLDGFILDGFPRTLSQAIYLKMLLERLNTPIDAVVTIDVDSKIIIERLTERRRYDDTPQTIKHRLDIYHRETAPLKEYYLRAGILRSIDGATAPENVTRRILQVIQPGGFTVDPYEVIPDA